MSARSKLMKSLDRDARIIELGVAEAKYLAVPGDLRKALAPGLPPRALDHALARDQLVEITEHHWTEYEPSVVRGFGRVPVLKKGIRARLTEVGKVVYLKILAATAPHVTEPPSNVTERKDPENKG